MERILTDFGADESFGRATKKVLEHYGIDVPVSTTRIKVEKHAEQMKKMNKCDVFKSSAKNAACVIAETDGGMVPLVSTEQLPKISGTRTDRRKNKTLYWKEGILSLAREHGKVQPYFYATLQSREDAGIQLVKCADLAGRYKKTQLHCLGDGAPWIADQVDSQFGSRASFLIDFYHLTQYLAGAALCIAPDNHLKQLESFKKLMLEDRSDQVFYALQEYIDNNEQEIKDCSVKNVLTTKLL